MHWYAFSVRGLHPRTTTMREICFLKQNTEKYNLKAMRRTAVDAARGEGACACLFKNKIK
jgi:hypothetical protein